MCVSIPQTAVKMPPPCDDVCMCVDVCEYTVYRSIKVSSGKGGGEKKEKGREACQATAPTPSQDTEASAGIGADTMCVCLCAFVGGKEGCWCWVLLQYLPTKASFCLTVRRVIIEPVCVCL